MGFSMSSETAPEPPQVAQVPEDVAAICDLPADQLASRAQTLRSDLLPLALGVERLAEGSGIALDFASSPEMQTKLEELIAFEKGCCGSLEWGLALGATPDRLRLTIGGLAPDSSLFALVASQDGTSGAATPSGEVPPSGTVAALAKAGGMGVGAALVLCCGVPLAATALIGGGVAASLTQLDNPVIIIPASLAIAAFAWRSARRREADCCN
ncbi:MAG: hypothetical protein ACI8TX_003324 [Hyphomicrobiaceae bacterium]